MIPVPLSPPARPSGRGSGFRPWWFGYWLATACFVVAAVGAIVWGAAASPFALARFSSYDAARTQNLRQSDTYVIYQEYEGAAEPSSPPPLDVKVKERYGTDVHVTMLQQPGEKTEVPAYRDPWHEGRAIAEFTITRPGPYDLLIQKQADYDITQYTGRSDGGFAVGRRISSTWCNSLLALGPLVALPTLLGSVLVIVTRRRRRAAPSAGGGAGSAAAPGSTSTPAGSVLVHG